MGSDLLTATRASAVRFELPPPFAGEVVIPAPSLQQVADCIRLDQKKQGQALLDSWAERLRAAGYTVTAPATPSPDAFPPESDRERILRMQRQAEILLGRKHAHLAGKLTMGQVTEVVQSLYLAAAGIDPTDFLAVQKYLRRVAEDRRGAAELAALIDRLILDLSVMLEIPQSEAARMPVADAVAQHEALCKKANEQATFDMAVHGATPR